MFDQFNNVWYNPPTKSGGNRLPQIFVHPYQKRMTGELAQETDPRFQAEYRRVIHELGVAYGSATKPGANSQETAPLNIVYRMEDVDEPLHLERGREYDFVIKTGDLDTAYDPNKHFASLVVLFSLDDVRGVIIKPAEFRYPMIDFLGNSDPCHFYFWIPVTANIGRDSRIKVIHFSGASVVAEKDFPFSVRS